MTQQQKTDNGNTLLTVAGQRRITLSGATSVDGFSETEISLSLPDGKLTVLGEHLKILSFNEENGSFTAEGKVLSVRYAGRKQPLLKKLIK
ncbi:MAG: YabP/YqfC family sporulation protein [Clostridia bacterium]|jgi:hypothetical protein|nr:YabP/YqfC family sporulation protein [Clostridia bacterium]MBQ5802209.1 YabP/YqfC family sporulation protein [Clostridia bacterium]